MIPIFNLKLLVIVWFAVIVTAVVSGMCLSAYTVDKLEEQEFEKVFSDIQVTAENLAREHIRCAICTGCPWTIWQRPPAFWTAAKRCAQAVKG